MTHGKILTAAIAVAIGGAVLDQVVTGLPAPAPGSVADVCNGVCGCGACPPSFYAVAVIGLLTVVASWVIGGPKWPPEEDEQS